MVDLELFHLSVSQDNPTRIMETYSNAWWSSSRACADHSTEYWRDALVMYRGQIEGKPVQEESGFFFLLDKIILDTMEVLREHYEQRSATLDVISDRLEELEVFLDACEVCMIPEMVGSGPGWVHTWVGCVKNRTDAQLVVCMLTSRARAAFQKCGSGVKELENEMVSG